MTERVPFRATLAGGAYEFAKLPVCLLLDNVRSMYNVGSFFRTADGAGVEKIYLSGITARPPKNAIAKTALGAEERVPWEGSDNALEAASALRSRGYELAALETSVRSVDLFDWTPRFPVCLMVGHEVDGLSEELLAACDVHVRIPMLGGKHSLNVATAGGVALYELLRKYRQAFGRGTA